MKVFFPFLLSAIVFSVFGFGKNKVEYEKFAWKYLPIPHFDVYYHQDQGALPRIAAQWIENAEASLARDFWFQPNGKIPLILYGSANYFERTNVVAELLPEGVGGFTTLMKNRIVVPFDGSYEELRHVLHHELVHGFQNALISDRPGGSFIASSEMSMPLWFAEGMAEYLSCGWNKEADMFLMDATIFGSVALPGSQLDGYMAYKGGQSFLYYLASTWGDSLFSKMLKRFGETKNAPRAIKDVYGKTPEELGETWRYALKQFYWPEIGRRSDLAKIGKPLTAHAKDRDNFNLRPRIAPNGSMVAYFSDLKDYTKILVVDRHEKILEEISQAGYAGSFESFHPFRSGMCWAPTSDKIAFVSENKGTDELRIIDIKKKKLLNTLRPNLSAIFSPDWSSDGKNIVFCGVDKDFCDLFLWNIQSNRIRRLTDDILFESDPRFSRDGKTVVYGRLDTSGIAARGHNIRNSPTTDLFSLNLADGATARLTHGPGNKKSPCFSPDGASILYVSDVNGINNLYIAPVASIDSARPLTDVIGDCQNPDWAKDSNTAVCCLFQKGGWDIWQIDNPASKLKTGALTLTKWAAAQGDSMGRFFEPADSVEMRRVQSLDSLRKTEKKQDHKSGFLWFSSARQNYSGSEGNIRVVDTSKTPSGASQNGDSALARKDSIKTRPVTLNFDSIQSKPYRVIFKPDMVMVGAGVDTYYGSGYAGEAVAVFSDLLGNHQITVAGDIQGDFVDYTHVYASYLNLEYKINYGFAGFYSRDYTSSNVYGDSLFFDVDAGLTLTASCPFSLFSRLELDATFQNLYREPYVYTDALGKDTGSANLTYNIFIPSLSYCYDNILWGITGPHNGTRAEASIEISPPVKHINSAFLSCDLDFRKYFHIFKRFVWANKIAFGSSVPLGGEQSSARKYFLGGDENWLNFETNGAGYRANINNFFYSQIVVPFRGWSYLDLIGTNYAVFNTEFRFPFIKEFSIAWPLQMALRYINGAVFADIGNAWNKEDEFKNIPLPKKIYGGVGYGLRANLGIFVVRYDYAWKTDWNTFLNSPISYISLGAEF